MDEKLITNEEKHDVYSKLHERLKKALASGFWLEATMIEYSIIEDRTAAIIYYTGIASKPWEKKLSNKLNSIEQQIGKDHPVLSKKVSPKTIQEIMDWKNKRNTAVHKACYTLFEEEDFKTIAEEGRELVRKISNDSQKVKRAVERRNKL